MHSFPARLVLVFLFSIILQLAYGQASTNEPYSRYGFGILEPNYFGNSRAMGGVSAGLREDNTLNIANPASYPSIRVTTLESGFKAKFISLRGNSAKENSSNASYSYIALGIPLSPKWTTVLALVPYSNLGYNQVLNGTDPFLGATSTIYAGQGGLSQAFMGHGFVLVKGLSLGFNLGYVFGNIQNSQSLQFLRAGGFTSDTLYDGRISSTTQFGGFNFEYGAQYSTIIHKQNKFTIGYNGSYGNTIISREKDYITRYRTDIRGNEGVLDTVLQNNQVPSYTYLPIRNAIGFSYKIKNKFLVAGDFDYDIYTGVVYNGANPGFRNNWKAAVGAQYTPDLTSVSNYFDLLDYRAGLYYNQTNLIVHQKGITQYGLTFGVGVPLRQYTQNQLAAKVNLSFDIGQMGTVEASNVRQRFVNVHLGFVLNQLWFNRYRYQ